MRILAAEQNRQQSLRLEIADSMSHGIGLVAFRCCLGSFVMAGTLCHYIAVHLHVQDHTEEAAISIPLNMTVLSDLDHWIIGWQQ